MSAYEFQHLNVESRDNWTTNADHWDERMGEGNDFHLELIEPAQLPLLDLQPDELVLDVACGNGQFARKMAQLGARVVATDASERMIENANARTTGEANRIEYSVVDATSREQGNELVMTYSVKVSRYITPASHKGVGMPGQPVAQTYFHRPISAILNACFKAGFFLDGIEEPTFQGPGRNSGPIWDNFTEIPPALVARMRPLR